MNENEKKKFKMPKMTARWLSSVFGVILVILAGFELTLSAVIFSYYHNSAEAYLKNRTENMTGYYNSYIAPQAASLTTGYRRLAEEYSDLSAAELQVVDLTASALAQDNRMPMAVFPLNEKDSVRRAMLGEINGTRVTV